MKFELVRCIMTAKKSGHNVERTKWCFIRLTKRYVRLILCPISILRTDFSEDFRRANQ